MAGGSSSEALAVLVLCECNLLITLQWFADQCREHQNQRPPDLSFPCQGIPWPPVGRLVAQRGSESLCGSVGLGECGSVGLRESLWLCGARGVCVSSWGLQNRVLKGFKQLRESCEDCDTSESYRGSRWPRDSRGGSEWLRVSVKASGSQLQGFGGARWDSKSLAGAQGGSVSLTGGHSSWQRSLFHTLQPVTATATAPRQH